MALKLLYRRIAEYQIIVIIFADCDASYLLGV